MLKLICSRHYCQYEEKHSNLKSAIKSALGMLEHEQGYPLKIIDDTGKVIWEEKGPFDLMESLRQIGV